MRVVAALLFGVVAVSVAACGEGGDASGPTEPPTEVTTTSRPEVVPTTTDPIGNAPVGLSGTELHVHGNMYGTLTDEAGNAMGVPDPTAGIQLTQTPGGSYLSTGDDEGGQYFLQEGVYEGLWTVKEDDEVRFVVSNRADDEIAETAATLPFVVRKGDTITMTLGTPADLGSLELTVDGRDDRTIQFGQPAVGAGASDRSQPVSRVEVEHVDGPGGKQLARVTITASDGGGSGVARIEYGLTPSNEAGVYTKPIEVPAVGQIVVRAIDRAGNIQAPYSRVSLAP